MIKMRKRIDAAKAFWKELKQPYFRKMKTVIASTTRPRKITKKGAEDCPISGSHGKALNMKRHPAQ